jgi:hypothetical protein
MQAQPLHPNTGMWHQGIAAGDEPLTHPGPLRRFNSATILRGATKAKRRARSGVMPPSNWAFEYQVPTKPATILDASRQCSSRAWLKSTWTVSGADAHCLMSLSRRAVAALNVDNWSRLYSQPLPRNIYLATLSAFAAAFKRREGLVDLADLAHGDYRISPQVKLVLMDEVDAADRALIARHFSNASQAASGLFPQGAKRPPCAI